MQDVEPWRGVLRLAQRAPRLTGRPEPRDRTWRLGERHHAGARVVREAGQRHHQPPARHRPGVVMPALGLVEGVAPSAGEALASRGHHVLRKRGLPGLDQADRVHVLKPGPDLGPVRHRVLRQSVRVRHDDVPALAVHRVGAHVVGPSAEVRHIIQPVHAIQGGQRMLGVEDRAGTGQPRASVANELIGEAAVADLELRPVGPLRAHRVRPQSGRDVGEVPGRDDLLPVVLAVEQPLLGEPLPGR